MTRILVVIDPKEEVHSALERCKEVSPEADLQIKVCMFIEADSAQTLAQTLKTKKAWLEEQIVAYRNIGYDISCDVQSFSRLYEAIIKASTRYDADLVFKPMRQHSLVRRVVLTSTDWNLIRFCPQPLLLVNGANAVHGKPVVAAVEVLSQDESHEALNQVVMEQAARVARVIGSEVTCVNAWDITSSVVAASSMDPTPYVISRDKRAKHIESARELAGQHGIPIERVIVDEGPANQVINTIAEEVGAGVVVIGTVARTGVSGLFIGNTAESVMDSSRCDVLVVKQPEFVCPLQSV